MAPSGFLNRLAGRYGYSRYLEVGVQTGRTFKEVSCGERMGMDPALRGKLYGVVRMTSDEFFDWLPSGVEFDLAFVDGLHLREQALRDVRNSLSRLSAGGMVVLHDCLPRSEGQQGRRQVGGSWTGDVWRAMAELRMDAGLESVTVREDWGFGVVWKGGNSEVLSGVDPEGLGWEDYAMRGDQLLRLMTFEEFWRFLDGHGPGRVG